jgi:hypothetical protein
LERLEALEKQYDKLKVYYTLTNPNENWTGLKGRIDKEKITQYFPKPGYVDLLLLLILQCEFIVKKISVIAMEGQIFQYDYDCQYKKCIYKISFF